MKINNYLPYDNDMNKYNSKNTDINKFKSRLKDAIREKDDKALMKQCKEFESIFINMLFKQMRSTVPESNLTDKSMAREVFEGMFDEEVAKKAAQGNGIGLASILYNQLSKKVINQE